MGVSNAILSNMFKYYLELGYYDYVNGYRLKEFKRYLEEKAYKQYTIIALSEKCGFKKSSFFTTFRKMEGMTPTEYLQKHTWIFDERLYGESKLTIKANLDSCCICLIIRGLFIL